MKLKNVISRPVKYKNIVPPSSPFDAQARENIHKKGYLKAIVPQNAARSLFKSSKVVYLV